MKDLHPLLAALMGGGGIPSNPIKGLKYMPVDIYIKLKDVMATYASVVFTTAGMEISESRVAAETLQGFPNDDKALLVEAWLEYMLLVTDKCGQVLRDRIAEIKKENR